MPRPQQTTEELFPYRRVHEILARRPRNVHAVGPGDPVALALQRMAQHDIGLVVVLEGERLVGVLSERDLARRAGSSEAGSLRDLRVDALMTREVATVGTDATFGDCVALMDAHGARHLPVLEAGRVVAVVTVRDLLREALGHHHRVLAEVDRERLLAFQPLA